MSIQTAIILAVVWPVFGSILVLLLRKRPNLREGASLLTAATQFILIATRILPR